VLLEVCVVCCVAGFIEVYLIDAVTGNIVFNCNHKRAKGPAHVIHSENWVVVSMCLSYYYNKQAAECSIFQKHCV